MIFKCDKASPLAAGTQEVIWGLVMPFYGMLPIAQGLPCYLMAAALAGEEHVTGGAMCWHLL